MSGARAESRVPRGEPSRRRSSGNAFPGRSLQLGLALLGMVGCVGTPAKPGSDGVPSTPIARQADSLPRIEVVGNRLLAQAKLHEVARTELDAARDDRGGTARLTRGDVDDMAYAVELHCRRLGFPDAYVDYSFDPGAGSHGAVELRIEEGRRVLVRRIAVPGGERLDLDRGELEALFLPASSALFTSRERWYVASSVQAGRATLEGLYLERGYGDVEVLEPRLVDVGDGENGERLVELIVEVREGPRFTFDAAEVTGLEGELALNDAEWAELDALRLDASGVPLPYTPRAPQAMRARLLELLGTRGHPDARVDVRTESDPTTGSVSARFDVRPGPRVQIRELEVRGNEKTRTGFVRRRLSLGPGDIYDLDEVRRSFRRLFATGLFQRVNLTLEHIVDADTASEPATVARRLVVDLVERPSLEFYAEPGYGSYEGLRLKLGALDRNVLGTGRSLRGETIFSAKYQRVLVGLSDRALFDSDVSGSASVHFSHREEPSFTHQELGVGIDLAQDWPTLGLEGIVGYGYRRTDVVDVEVQSPDLSAFLSNIDISSAHVTLARDTRDHLFLPTRGSRTQLEFEYSDESLGSEVNFLNVQAAHAHFFALPWSDAVFGVGMELGVTAPIHGQQVLPLQVRRFNGGATTVRSFDQDELGPLDVNGEPLGGEGSSVVSLELRQGLLGNLSGALFYDAGHLTPRYEELFEFNGMRQAVGLGLRYLLPIGPARIDLGVNPDPGSRDEEWIVHFAVGLAF